MKNLNSGHHDSHHGRMVSVTKANVLGTFLVAIAALASNAAVATDEFRQEFDPSGEVTPLNIEDRAETHDNASQSIVDPSDAPDDNASKSATSTAQGQRKKSADDSEPNDGDVTLDVLPSNTATAEAPRNEDDPATDDGDTADLFETDQFADLLYFGGVAVAGVGGLLLGVGVWASVLGGFAFFGEAPSPVAMAAMSLFAALASPSAVLTYILTFGGPSRWVQAILLPVPYILGLVAGTAVWAAFAALAFSGGSNPVPDAIVPFTGVFISVVVLAYASIGPVLSSTTGAALHDLISNSIAEIPLEPAAATATNRNAFDRALSRTVRRRRAMAY